MKASDAGKTGNEGELTGANLGTVLPSGRSATKGPDSRQQTRETCFPIARGGEPVRSSYGVSPAEIKHRLAAGALIRVHRAVFRVGHCGPSLEAR